MFGRMMIKPLGKLHFWPTFLALNVVFGGQLLIGWAGMQRRLYDPSAYEFLRHLLPWDVWVLRAAYVLGAAQNPWEGGTLEWTVPSPPPHHNFDVIPTVVRGPHELGSPDARARGKDW